MRKAATLLALTLSAAAALACSGPEPATLDSSSSASANPVTLIGAAGDTVVLESPPTRIVALIPGVNEILVDLGARDRIVGRTDYDTLSVLRALPSVGGGIGPNLESLTALRPDLVVRFEGAQDARTARRLTDLGIPHLGVRPDGIADIRTILVTMGRAVQAEAEAARLAQGIDDGLDAIRDAVSEQPTLRVAWLLGGTPPLAAGPGTFLHELVEIAGGVNVFADLGELYTPVSMETLRARDIQVIVTGEGTVLDERVAEGRRVARVPSWVQIPGPGIVRSAREVARALHPELPEFAGGRP